MKSFSVAEISFCTDGTVSLRCNILGPIGIVKGPLGARDGNFGFLAAVVPARARDFLKTSRRAIKQFPARIALTCRLCTCNYIFTQISGKDDNPIWKPRVVNAEDYARLCSRSYYSTVRLGNNCTPQVNGKFTQIQFSLR